MYQTTMPSYKLTYFNSRGSAETARMIMACGGIQYDDNRVNREQWLAMKPNSPFGQLPVLEIDGNIISQSDAISRYLAKQCGLVGKNDYETARVDMVVDCIKDITKPLYAIFSEKDEAKKDEIRKQCQEVTLPDMLGRLEKLLISNNKGDGYFVGDQMTWADIKFANDIMGLKLLGITMDWEAICPKLSALKQRVESNPKLAAWIQSRPQTNY